jgi:hypothetical protein
MVFLRWDCGTKNTDARNHVFRLFPRSSSRKWKIEGTIGGACLWTGGVEVEKRKKDCCGEVWSCGWTKTRRKEGYVACSLPLSPFRKTNRGLGMKPSPSSCFFAGLIQKCIRHEICVVQCAPDLPSIKKALRLSHVPEDLSTKKAKPQVHVLEERGGGGVYKHSLHCLARSFFIHTHPIKFLQKIILDATWRETAVALLSEMATATIHERVPFPTLSLLTISPRKSVWSALSFHHPPLETKCSAYLVMVCDSARW